MKPLTMVIFAVFLVLASFTDLAKSHGRLIEPPSRSSMWRYGWQKTSPPNYDDHELFCGGFRHQWEKNGGKCGVCGDPWDNKMPRANEAGGRYGNGIIVRKYVKNKVMKVRVELTANHMGYFQFRLCPNNDINKIVTQACLDEHVLENVITKSNKYYPGTESRVYELLYQLPKDMTCKQCVLQWRYVAGNDWGFCKNGTGSVGCGNQEEFRACADISITEEDGSADDTPNNLEDDLFLTTPRNGRGLDNNNVDFEKQEEDLKVERVLIIALFCVLVVSGFFLTLFFYYTRGRDCWNKHVGDKVQKISKVNMPKMKLSKASMPNWPLTDVPVNKLPPFFKRSEKPEKPQTAKRVTTVSAPINVVSSTNEAATGPPTKPLAPPRAKKNPPPAIPQLQQQQQPRLATISSRPHPSSASVTRPSAPPPVVPPGIEIGAPTSVTINGVSVSPNGDIPGTTDILSEVTANSTGYFVPATPATIDENMPDSMEQQAPQANFENVKLDDEL